jgi:hypothetical protein
MPPGKPGTSMIYGRPVRQKLHLLQTLTLVGGFDMTVTSKDLQASLSFPISQRVVARHYLERSFCLKPRYFLWWILKREISAQDISSDLSTV